MNLLDSLCSEGHRHKSVVQLSQTRSFKRSYSSISDAIVANAKPFKEEAFQKALAQLLHQTMDDISHNYYGLDGTSQPRPYSKTLAERTIVHSPNPSPGNKPISIGHGYSDIA